MAPDKGYEAFRKTINQFEQDALVQNRVKAALLHSPDRFRSFMKDAPFSIEIYSPDGVLREVNRTWKNLYLVPQSEVIDKFNALQDGQAVALGSVQNFERVLAGEALRLPDYEFDPALSGLPGRKRRLRPAFYPLSSWRQTTKAKHSDPAGRRKSSNSSCNA